MNEASEGSSLEFLNVGAIDTLERVVPWCVALSCALQDSQRPWLPGIKCHQGFQTL